MRDTAHTAAIFAGINLTTGKAIFVREGETGYWEADGIDVAWFNERQGWTAEEAEFAVMASCFGWDKPIAKKALAAIARVNNRG